MSDSITRLSRLAWLLVVSLVASFAAVGLTVYLNGVVVEQNRDNIRELACILVSQTPDDPAKPLVHDFRVKYHCPAFNPAAVGHLPTPTVTRTVPGAKTTATATQTMHIPVPQPTTFTVPGQPQPGRTITVTRTRTVTRTVAPPPCLKNPTLPCTLTAR